MMAHGLSWPLLAKAGGKGSLDSFYLTKDKKNPPTHNGYETHRTQSWEVVG